MDRSFRCLVVDDLSAGPAASPAPAPASTTEPAAAPAPVPVRNPDLPPSERQSKAVLEQSPRHGEYVDIKHPAGGTPIRTWVSYPERKDKAGVVILIHDIGGLSDWMRGVADQLARDGFIAVVPDLVSGMGPTAVAPNPWRAATMSRSSCAALRRTKRPPA